MPVTSAGISILAARISTRIPTIDYGRRGYSFVCPGIKVQERVREGDQVYRVIPERSVVKVQRCTETRPERGRVRPLQGATRENTGSM